MSASRRLPAELTAFLSLPGPQSLLIRGPPGSGKTTLSMGALEAFQGRKILVTSRVSSTELQREFPWLGENAGSNIEIVETKFSLGRVVEASKAISSLGTLLASTGTESGELRSFLWLPPALQEAWSRLSEASPAIVVVDSWDALVESYLGSPPPTGSTIPDRSEVERLLLTKMAEAPIHLVLVLEREQQNQLDYLVNGVVQAQTEFRDDRMERWLLLRKLRGIRIANAMYPYTLEGGRFECIEPMHPYSELPTGRAEEEPNPMAGYIWPGSAAFAESFGRLPVGGMTLLELDPSVPQSIPYFLFAPTIAQVASKGGPVLILPDTAATPGLLWKRVRSSVSQGKFLEHVRFVVPPNQPSSGRPDREPGLERTLMLLEPPKPGAPNAPNPLIEEFMRSGDATGVPSLGIFHITGLYTLANAFNIPITGEAVQGLPGLMQAFTAGKLTHSIIIGRSGEPLFERMRPLANLHLKARTRQGRTILQGLFPWTPNFLLAAGQEHPPYQLLQVV